MNEIWLITSTETLAPIAEHQSVEFACENAAGNLLRLVVDGQQLEAFLHPGEMVWRWRWNPGAAVGAHSVVLETPETPLFKWSLWVAPRKIDQERYEQLLDDLRQIASRLAFDLGAASSEGASAATGETFSLNQLEAYFSVFEARFEPFVQAVRRIASHPRSQHAPASERVPLGRADRVSAAALANIARGAFDQAPAGVAEGLQASFRPEGGLLPREVIADRPHSAHDSYEHRLIKHTLGALLRRARLVGEVANQLAQAEERAMNTGRHARIRQIADGCAAAEQTVRTLRGLSLFEDVKPLAAFRGPTALLQRDPAYRETYRMWQALRQQLELDSPLFAIPIIELPYLYETWCALRVAAALLRLGGELRHQQLVTETDAARVLRLVEDKPLLVVALGETTATLRYQPRYRPGAKHNGALQSLDRHTRVPDLALEVARPNTSPQVLVFDAKYRLDSDGRGVPPDALADAYAYLGAIGIHGQRATCGALLLYPGQRDERYPSAVGALSLLPGQPDALEAVIREAIAG